MQEKPLLKYSLAENNVEVMADSIDFDGTSDKIGSGPRMVDFLRTDTVFVRQLGPDCGIDLLTLVRTSRQSMLRSSSMKGTISSMRGCPFKCFGIRESKFQITF